MKIPRIQKRDSRVVKFDINKIRAAISKAFAAAGKKDPRKVEAMTQFVVKILEKNFASTKQNPKVEEVQDVVERVLMNNKESDVAKAYIIYREKHKKIREAKKFFVEKDDALKLSLNAIKVLERRYLKKDEGGKIAESPAEMFQRVAKSIAEVEKNQKEREKAEKEFFKMMSELKFLPNSPTLMNAGTRIGQLSACYVLPIEDSLKSIFTTLKNTALIHQSGGGTGFSFSRIRPRGTIVGSTRGVASGPLSFMHVFDSATEVIKQGGRRRGANMGILDVDHPDILEFIVAKQAPGFLQNFNISVAVTEKFMDAVRRRASYALKDPKTDEAVAYLNAADVFDTIVFNAWQTGDPGLIFIDEINKHNPTPKLGAIESTNPCGEQPLLANESCNLGSINLARFVGADSKIQWQELKKTIRTAVQFLDDVIDANKFPIKQIAKVTKANRKIGLGVMGFADMLVKLGIPYDSDKAVETAERLMKFVHENARKASSELAKKRKSFPNFKKSIFNDDKRGFKKSKFKYMRNASVTTVAPTGSISIIAGCSSGIEPLFAVSFVRNVMEGTELLEVNPEFERIAKARGFYSKELMFKIAKQGSIQDIKEIPADVRRLFVTALDIKPEWHIRMQAAFQKHTDSAVSKTINFPHDATKAEIGKAYLLAHRLKCKGITVYRYGSKEEQVLYIGSVFKKGGPDYVSAHSEYAGGCAASHCPF